MIAPKGQSDILKYPANLNDLYGKDEINIIKFIPHSFENSRFENFKYSTKSIPNGVVFLELSDSITIGDSHSWEAGDTFGGRSKNPNTWQNSVSNHIDQVQDALQKIGYGVGFNIAGKALGMVGGQYLNDSTLQNTFVVGKGRTLVNPNTTLIYSSSGLRSLNLNFILKPEDEAEAKVITQIVNFFKYYSRGSTDIDKIEGISFPYLWYISTSSDELNKLIESGEKESTSILFACNSVSPVIKTNVMYHNNYPHEIDLTLEFTEMLPRYREISSKNNK
jgi:hypothetical protein